MRDRSNRTSLWALFVTLGLLAAAPPLRAADPPRASDAPAAEEGVAEKTEFLRFVDDDDGGGKLESAIATYRNEGGVKVHLVAALHVGEKSYYHGLSKTFEGYDALLYEMVKPKGAGAPAPGQQAGGMVSGFQRFLKDVLELEFQLDAIDYTADNFVHADLDVETFFKLQEERGESLFTLMLRSMMSQMARQGQPGAPRPITMFDILAAMNSPDSARQYKLLLARQFQDVEAQIAAMEGPNGSVLLTERNKAAMRVVKEQLAAGKKNLGVFYGAAHMKDLERRLIDELGFKRTNMEYRIAWDLTPKNARARAGGDEPANRSGAVGTDKQEEKDAQIKMLLEKIEKLEKKVNDLEEKKDK